MKIPRDAWRNPLIILTDNGYIKNDQGRDRCLLWGDKNLDTHLSINYPEVYAFLQEGNRQSQEQPQD